MKEKVTEEEWIRRGDKNKSVGRFEQAVSCYQKAIHLNSKNSTAWTNKGLVYESLEKHHLAIDCYERALSVDPSLEEVENYRIRALEKSVDPESIRRQILNRPEGQKKEMKRILKDFETTGVFALLGIIFIIGCIVSSGLFIISYIDGIANWGALTTAILNLISGIAWIMIAGKFNNLRDFLNNFVQLKKFEEKEKPNEK